MRTWTPNKGDSVVDVDPCLYLLSHMYEPGIEAKSVRASGLLIQPARRHPCLSIWQQ